ncbi:MFS transporter [Solobacterium moorei]|uniref:MFS transporter n=1 Tax=Solobacterium moorei TaxID=102148 RepID=UPI0024AC8EFE|nr:MFS transporter [Solobacterium moorei]MDI6413806.1 MFS transporter [Solobacterium moorei]
MDNTKQLNIEYFSLQSLFWMTYCMVVGFSVTYLLSCGYSNSEAGYILASANICALILQPFLADLADHSKKINAMTILLISIAIIFVCSIGLFFISIRSAVLTLIYVVMITLANAVIAFLTSVQFLMDTSKSKINFGLCRAGGSLCFAILSALMGIIIERIGMKSIPTALFIITLLIIALCMCITRHRINDKQTTGSALEKRQSSSLFVFFRENPKFMILSVAMLFIYYAHAFITNFTISIVRNVGGNHREMGYLIAFMALMELPGMIGFKEISRRFKVSSLLLFSMIMFSVKAIIVWLSPSLITLTFGFALQVVSFALYIPASVQYANIIIDEKDTVKAQMMFNFMQAGGAVFSSIIGGWLIDFSGISHALLVGAILSCIGTMIAFMGIQNTKR